MALGLNRPAEMVSPWPVEGSRNRYRKQPILLRDLPI